MQTQVIGPNYITALSNISIAKLKWTLKLKDNYNIFSAMGYISRMYVITRPMCVYIDGVGVCEWGGVGSYFPASVPLGYKFNVLCF